MRGPRLSAAVALVLGAGTLVAISLPAGAAPADANCPLTGTGRSMVQFAPDVTAASAAAALRAAGATRVEAVAGGLAVGDLHGRHERPRGALAVSPERVRPYLSVATDPFADQQWALDVQHADQAATKADGSGVTVAVLDSGVDATHADLAGQILSGADATTSPPTTIPAGVNSDTAGHGTFVAGVIAALRGNGVGIAGMAPGARIMPIRVGDANGVTTAAFVRGMDYAVNHGARVINLSFGGCGFDSTEQAAVDQAAAAGIVVVAAAGNLASGHEGEAVTVYPAAYANVVAVGATTRQDAIAAYSVTGPFVDLTAPGGAGTLTLDTDIVSTAAPGAGCTANCYAIAAGTSFAAPYAAAVMALVWGVNPGLTASQVVDTVEGTSIDLGAPGADPVFGAGRVDAGGAVAKAKATRALSRIAGTDRYATAATLSASAHPNGAPVAYLARGDVFSPDALTAGPAAILGGAPLLLSATCSLPGATASELTRLGAGTVIVLGGSQAVCDAVLAQVSELSTRPKVQRVAGADRYLTAAALANTTFPKGSTTAYLARGDIFSPDALVGGTEAGLHGAPILLAGQCSVPDATVQALNALGVTHVVVLGGSQAVCDQAVAQVSSGGRTVERRAGADRYATAVAIGNAGFGPGANGVLVARGDAFSPDALAAAPFAALEGTPLLLTSQCYAPPATAIDVDTRDATAVHLIGGPGAVCDFILARFH